MCIDIKLQKNTQQYNWCQRGQLYCQLQMDTNLLTNTDLESDSTA